MVRNMEKLAADFFADPEKLLPGAAVMESAKSYRGEEGRAAGKENRTSYEFRLFGISGYFK